VKWGQRSPAKRSSTQRAGTLDAASCSRIRKLCAAPETAVGSSCGRAREVRPSTGSGSARRGPAFAPPGQLTTSGPLVICPRDSLGRIARARTGALAGLRATFGVATGGGLMASSKRSVVVQGAVSDGPGGKVIRFTYGRNVSEIPGTSTAVAQCLAEVRLHLAAASNAQSKQAVALVYQTFDEIADVERMVGPVAYRLLAALAATSVPEALITRLQDLTERAAAVRRHPGDIPPAALDLLAQAEAGLQEASTLESANERFATAHLSALRTAAAVLAARGRPPEDTSGVRRRTRIRSAWEVLPEIAPELTEWSTLFATQAATRARAEAGIKGAATMHEAEELIRAAGDFLRITQRLLLQGAPHHAEERSQRPARPPFPPGPGATPQRRPPRSPLGHTPPGPPLGDDDDEWDE